MNDDGVFLKKWTARDRRVRYIVILIFYLFADDI